MSEKRFGDLDSGLLDFDEAVVAAELEAYAKAAAMPIEPGEGIAEQVSKAARNLGLRGPRGERRVRAAWYGEAGCWSARKYLAFKARFEAYKRSTGGGDDEP